MSIYIIIIHMCTSMSIHTVYLYQFTNINPCIWFRTFTYPYTSIPLQTHLNHSLKPICISPYLHRQTTNILHLSQSTKDIPYAKKRYFSDLRTPFREFCSPPRNHSAEKHRGEDEVSALILALPVAQIQSLLVPREHCLDGKISPSTVGTREKRNPWWWWWLFPLWGERKCWKESSWSNPMLFWKKFLVVDVFLLLEMICFFGQKPMDVGPKMLRHRRPSHSY